MLPFALVHAGSYHLPLGGHVFPGEKYQLIHDRLLADGVAGPEDFIRPEPATDEDVLRVHHADYVRRLRTGAVSAAEMMRMELPWDPALVDAFWLMAGGSILAARRALADGVALNIGGGFHHACPDHGEGFCMIHDVAIALRRLHHDAAIRRAMVVDLDVHHGNGTATIFPPRAPGRPSRPLPSAGPAISGTSAASDDAGLEVFTVSLHQENNYPAWKPPSSIDVHLPDGTDDDRYLAGLEQASSAAFRQFRPDVLAYIAGADPYREDQLGGLALTIDGLRERDRFLFRTARREGVPVFVTFAGGYARRVADTVAIHCNTVRAAAEVWPELHEGTSRG